VIYPVSKLSRWAANAEVGSLAEKSLLLVLAGAHADRDGLISPGPSWMTLAREAKLGRSTVHITLQKLVDRGYVEVRKQHRENGSQRPNDYQLLWTEEAARPVQSVDRYPSSQWTGTRPAAGPVQSLDGSDPSSEKTSLTSENADPSSQWTGTRPAAGPLEQEIKNSSGSVRAPAPARATRAPARGNINTGPQERLQQLAESQGVSKDAYVLVTRWRAGHGNATYTSNLYTRIGKVVTKLLDDGRVGDVVSEALLEWDRRDKAAPGLLPDLCDDVLKRRRAGVVTPLIQRDGTCSMPVAQITDDMLTRRVLEDILGPDMHQLLAPGDVEDGDPAARDRWYRDADAARLAARRGLARDQLARQQQKAGSA
jgi:hypothetical protein